MTAIPAFAAMARAVACGGSSDSDESPTAAAPTATAAAAVTPTPTPAPTPTPSPPAVVDAVYAEPAQASAEAWALDIYAPSKPTAVPAVVILPGAGSTRATGTVQDLARSISDLGAVVFVADFRAGDALAMFRDENATPLREATEGAACAIRFARANAAEHGGGSGRVLVIGQSAGGFLGLWAALVGDDIATVWDEVAADRGGPLPQLECVATEGSARPDAFVGYAGAYSIMELLKAEDPELAAVLTPDTYLGDNLDVVIRLLQGTSPLDAGTDTPFLEEPHDVIPPVLHEQHEALSRTLADTGYDATWTTVEAGHFLSPASSEAILSALADILG